MALAGKSWEKEIGTVNRLTAPINSETFWIPTVGYLERLGLVSARRLGGT